MAPRTPAGFRTAVPPNGGSIEWARSTFCGAGDCELTLGGERWVGGGVGLRLSYRGEMFSWSTTVIFPGRDKMRRRRAEEGFLSFGNY